MPAPSRAREGYTLLSANRARRSLASALSVAHEGRVGVAHQSAGLSAPPAWLEQVRQEQIASLYRNVLLGTGAVWVAGGILGLLLVQQHVASASTFAIWFALVSLLTLSRYVLAVAYKRASDARTNWRKWGAWFTAGTVSSGIVWGVGTLFLMSPARLDMQLLVIVLLTAVSYGALAAFGRWIPAFFGFFLPAMVPSALWSLFQGDVPHIVYGVLALIWIPAVAWMSLGFQESAVQALSLGFENAALADDLRRQKQLADGANLAKSRFLAAASHDLRQPVHALGLFVAALKNEPLDLGAQRLVDQIDGTVDGLDSLFTALLDVSRLDAGVVHAESRPTPLRPMLERIVGELLPEAKAKGLNLRLRASDVWVTSDAVLLERVLRNLVANAVMHTQKGGVLVEARSVGRAQASVEVWDTGPGIPDAQRDLVFQEFYQLSNAERRREGGLGLGLAIVQRLCALMAHPLTLRSVEGRGSVFRVSLPLAAAGSPSESPSAFAAAPSLRIWVIDDDVAARHATEAVLASWGHAVRTAGSSAEALEHVAAGETPQLILCDYRLANEDGISVIAALRTRIGVNVSAALITGDTAPDRLQEAAASGLPIVHKPVSKGKLRALVGNLTRAKTDAS